jgi:predicted transcriptional regulator
MNETLSIRIDTETEKRLDALSKGSRRSKSLLAAEAIAANVDVVDVEKWRLGDIQQGVADLESGKRVSHDRITKWLNMWGRRGETKAPKSGSPGH